MALKGAPKGLQEVTRKPQEAPRRPPGCPQEAPKMPPRDLQEAPRVPTEAPKTLQEASATIPKSLILLRCWSHFGLLGGGHCFR
eukprot:5443980-Pyramimonas_sp.AAC.1